MRRPLVIVPLAVLAVVLALLIVGQLILPGLAASRLRDKLSRYGTVRSVHVAAFPAIELLWHHADSVKIEMATYRSPSTRLGSLVNDAGAAGSVDATADEADVGLLKLHQAVLRKRGQALSAAANVTESDLRAAAPFLVDVVPIASADGALVLRGTASVLGLSATVDATVATRDGAVLVAPDVPFGALATVTLFSDPRVDVTSVGAAPAPGGFSISARGRLR